MLKGLFQAAGGMKTRLAVQDIIANNLANAGTTGFQREIASVQSRRLAREQRPAGPNAAVQPPIEFLDTTSSADTHPGVLQRTGSETDVALEGPGYLTVQTSRGMRLTRGGSLRVNVQGQLTALGGEVLLSTDGKPIGVGSKPWQVAPDGTVTAGGKVLGRLRVVLPTAPPQREGAALFAAAGIQETSPPAVRVLQGYLEHSNVEPVREMVDMIAGVRAYESAQRAVLAQDTTLQALLDVLRRP